MLVAFSCPVCGDGQVGFRCQGDNFFLLCGDCGYFFAHPSKAEAQDGLDPLHPTFWRRYPEIELREARWATQDEIEAKGWGAYLLKPTDLQ